MPGLAEYLTAAQLGANLLALPQTIRQQGQGNEAIRASLAETGLDPTTVDRLAPKPLLRDFPGNNVPGLGQVLRGVGIVGQVLQNVTGSAPAAPRLPLGQFVALQQLQAGREKTKAGQSIAQAIRSGASTEEIAARMAEGGNPGTAGRLIAPQKSSTGTNALQLELEHLKNTDPKNPRVKELQNTIDAATNRAIAVAQQKNQNINIQTTDPEQYRRQALGDIIKKATELNAQISAVHQDVVPLMKQAIPALTTSPLYAKTVQPFALWWQAATGNQDAAAAQLSASNAIRLARTVDVGNISGSERIAWDKFVRVEDMTGPQAATALRLLEAGMRRKYEQNTRIINSRSVEEANQFMTPQWSDPAADHKALDDAGLPR